jgi:hypothetical protein
MERLSLQDSRFRNACAIAIVMAMVGLTWSPRQALACPRICPQFLTQYCVLEPDGTVSSVETNPCFACKQHLRILYQGACKVWFGPPRTCSGTSCK